MLPLVPFNAKSPFQVTALYQRSLDGDQVQFQIKGPISTIDKDHIGVDQVGYHLDLWQQMCFELFLWQGPQYWEWNLSRSGSWARFAFHDYRSGMQEQREHPPLGQRLTIDGDELRIGIKLPTPAMYGAEATTRYALTCVIKAEDQCHYFAMSHPKEKADFHDPSCYQDLCTTAHER